MDACWCSGGVPQPSPLLGPGASAPQGPRRRDATTATEPASSDRALDGRRSHLAERRGRSSCGGRSSSGN
eukprot:11563614-Alexandrium_andersonii.AAC.1